MDNIITQANKVSLEIILRIGYTWDFFEDGNENVSDRYYDILFKEKTMGAWLDYVETIYKRVSIHPNLKGAFICWEDFWSPTYRLKAVENREESVQISQAIGYQEFLRNKYSINEINKIYNEAFEDYEQIYMPLSSSEAIKLFYEYYDQVLNQILIVTQEKFPDISMEVRVDDDLVPKNDGLTEWYSHKATYSSGKAPFTCIVYGIPMGFENKGERVTWEEAKNMFSYTLDRVNNETNNKPIFIDQFLFADNTPGFEHNAQIKEDEVGKFLTNIDDVLAQKTMGYGIWAYRDYRGNILYNSQFANDLQGYNIQGNVEIDTSKKSKKARLVADTSIEQVIPEQRNHFGNNINFNLEFDAILVGEDTILEIFIGDNIYKVDINVSGKYVIELKEVEIPNIKIKCLSGEVVLDNLNLYNQVQQGLLYSSENDELKHISDLRELNKKIDTIVVQVEKDSPLYSFYNEFEEVELLGYHETKDNPWGMNIGKAPIEGYDKTIFISPNTEFSSEIEIDDQNRVLEFGYMFHPIAREFGSDGLMVDVKISDQKNQELLKTIEILPNTDLKSESIKLNKFKGKKIRITFKIYNKEENNDLGDWGVVINPMIK